MVAHQHRTFKLALKTELREGQTLMSFVSALASLNGLRSTSRFALAFGIDLAGLKYGRPDALERFSQLTEIGVNRLLVAAHQGTPRTNLVGHSVDRKDIAAETRICPQCLTEDHAAQPGFRIETAVHYRAAWSHALVRSCAAHNLLLMPLCGREEGQDPRDDFAAAIRLAVDTSGLPEAVPSTALPVEIYIQSRLAARATQVPLLDTLRLSDALFLCRYLGAQHREASRPVPAGSIAERLEQSNQGFLTAVEGKEAIKDRLVEIADTINPYGAAEVGLRRIFMDLYDRVKGTIGEEGLLIRKILVEVGITQNLIGFEHTEALGLPVPQRTTQTILSASKRFGISDRELRAALIQLNAIQQNDARRSGDSVLFDVEPVSGVLSRLKSSLNLVETAQILGLHPEQMVRICDAQLLEPFFIRSSADLKPLRYFERSEVEAFLARLTAQCVGVSDAGERLDIWEAGLKTCRRPVDIIAAIYDGRIGRTYRIGPRVDLRTLLVDVDDVRNCVFEESDELVSAEDCSRILTINITAMRVIMQAGILQSEMGLNPVNRRQQLSARLEAVRAFKTEYISLNALSKAYGSSGTGMMQALYLCGLRPAIPPEQSVVRLYSQAAVRAVHAKVEQIMCDREVARPRPARRETLKAKAKERPRVNAS